MPNQPLRKPISPFDGHIRSEVAKVQTKLLQLQSSLYGGPHDDCACGPDSLCSFHAEIYNNLDEAINRTGHVIDSIDKLSE